MIEKKTNKYGMHYFTVKAHNGQIIVSSELYTSEEGRDRGIETLKDVMKDLILLGK